MQACCLEAKEPSNLWRTTLTLCPYFFTLLSRPLAVVDQTDNDTSHEDVCAGDVKPASFIRYFVLFFIIDPTLDMLTSSFDHLLDNVSSHNFLTLI